MDNQELISVVLYMVAVVAGVVLGAYIRGQSAQEAINEAKANKEQLNDWTGKLADAIPSYALKAINEASQNAQEITRFVLAAQFPGVPFTSQLKSVAEIAGGVADIVEDVTDGVQEPAPFANKGIPLPPAA